MSLASLLQMLIMRTNALDLLL